MKTITKTKHFFKRHFVLLTLGLLVWSGATIAQNKTTVTGIVTDATKSPIPGASIMVKGTSNGTITDINGAFTISCNANDTLVFSFIGLKTLSAAATPGQPMNITLLEDFTQLNEVVVVGYGTMRKQDLTGSISSVKSEDLNKGVITTTEQVLQGKVAGLTVIKGSGDPTEGATMRLRGGTSLIASSTPLVVIDGIVGADINSIQPSEIQSVDVLKDASAAAIYGSRGANGVILISTNKAGKGKHIEYSNYVSWGKQSKYLDVLSADDWRKYVKDWKKTKAVDFGGNTDWQKEITRTSFTQSHALVFSNSNDNGGFRASVSYLDNQGIVLKSELKRMGASLSAFTFGFDNKLKIELGVHTTFDEYNPVDNVYNYAYMLNPTAPVYDSLGNYYQTLDSEGLNPVEILNNGVHDNSRKRVVGYIKGELEIIKGLKEITNASYEYNSNQSRLYYPTYSKYGLTDRGFAQRGLNDYRNVQLESYFNYDYELNEHRVNLMAGYSYAESMYEGFLAQNRSFDTDLFLYNNLGAGNDIQSGDVSSYKSKFKLISFYGRLNYSYNGKYVFTGTLRRDGSSKFGKNNKWGLFPSAALSWKISDENFMDFATSWLDFMKLRLGYGVAGSQEAIDPYMSLQRLGIPSDPTEGGGSYYDSETQTWKISYIPVSNANPDLKWETTSQTNFGVDFSLLNKLNVTLDLYKKVTSDLLFTYSVPQPPNLYNKTTANVGQLSNKGFELALSYNILKKDDLNWDATLTMAKNTMKIDKLSNDEYGAEAIPSGDLHGIRGMSNAYSQTIREGYSVGTFWGQKCSGLNEKGQFLNVNGDVLKAKDDSLNTDLGNAQPKFTLGFNTSVTYKDFDFSISTYGMFGQKVLNVTAMALNDNSRFPQYNVQHKMVEDSITSNATFSSYWIEDASFFRIQSVTMGYTFKFKDIGIERIRLYASGENLWVFTKYSGLDPEIKLESYDSNEGKVTSLKNPGIDWFDVYPRPRMFTIGLSCTF